jgi:hypothetical protein
MCMRVLACGGAVLVLGAMVTACSTVKTIDVPVAATSASPSTSAGASASTAAASAAAVADRALLGVLSVPAGAQPWTANTGKLMNTDTFVKAFYVQSAWAVEDGALPRRGFVSGVIEGWINHDGTQQSITIFRFATPDGAVSMYDALTNTLRDSPAPATVLTDSADGGAGTVSPTLDKLGNAVAEIAAHTGDYVIDVHEYAAATPDPAAAKALLLKQYDSLKQG